MVTVKANVHMIHSILTNAVILFAIKKLIVNIADMCVCYCKSSVKTLISNTTGKISQNPTLFFTMEDIKI